MLVAYNLEEMHRILVLNFFRFIDELDNAHYRDQIYTELAKLDDQTLKEKLTEIGQKMIDTMEFNFYGAYKIDFSALKTIRNESPEYTLHMDDFIQQLNVGNHQALAKANEKLPDACTSYRFLDYLLFVTKNDDIRRSLNDIRSQFSGPSFKC